MNSLTKVFYTIHYCSTSIISRIEYTYFSNSSESGLHHVIFNNAMVRAVCVFVPHINLSNTSTITRVERTNVTQTNTHASGEELYWPYLCTLKLSSPAKLLQFDSDRVLSSHAPLKGTRHHTQKPHNLCVCVSVFGRIPRSLVACARARVCWARRARIINGSHHLSRRPLTRMHACVIRACERIEWTVCMCVETGPKLKTRSSTIYGPPNPPPSPSGQCARSTQVTAAAAEAALPCAYHVRARVASINVSVCLRARVRWGLFCFHTHTHTNLASSCVCFHIFIYCLCVQARVHCPLSSVAATLHLYCVSFAPVGAFMLAWDAYRIRQVECGDKRAREIERRLPPDRGIGAHIYTCMHLTAQSFTHHMLYSNHIHPQSFRDTIDAVMIASYDETLVWYDLVLFEVFCILHTYFAVYTTLSHNSSTTFESGMHFEACN